MRERPTRGVMALLVRGIRPLLGLTCLLALGAAAEAACLPPQGRHLDYRVLVDGSPAGRLKIDFQGDGVRTSIRTTIDLKVTRFLLIPVLIYRHQSEETWTGGGFRHFSGRTVDNGREYIITVDAQGEGLRVVTNGRAKEVTGALLSHAVWCQETLENGHILSPLKGRLRSISAEYGGEERRKLGGRTYLARRYAVTRDGRPGAVWYGEDGILIEARFPTKRGNQGRILLHRTGPLEERAGGAAAPLPDGLATPYTGWSMRHWADR